MKFVFFVEGYHDVCFLNTCFRHIEKIDEEEIRCFPRGEKEQDSNDRITRSFFEKGNPNTILVKMENGIDNTIEAFCHFLVFISDSGGTPILLIDLDEEESSDFVRTLEEHLHKTRPRNFQMSYKTIDHTGEMMLLKASLSLGRSLLSSFPIIAFKDSLEAEARINDTDNCQEIQRKIANLLKEKRDILGCLSSCLNIN